MFIKLGDERLGQGYIQPPQYSHAPAGAAPQAPGMSSERPLPCVNASISCLRAWSAVSPAAPGGAAAGRADMPVRRSSGRA